MANGTHRGGRKRHDKPKGRKHKPNDLIALKIRAGLTNNEQGNWVALNQIKSGKVSQAGMAAQTRSSLAQIDNLAARKRRGTVNGHDNWARGDGEGWHQA